MRTKSNDRLKTLGPQAARLVTTLHERGRCFFTLAEVAEITRLRETSAGARETARAHHHSIAREEVLAVAEALI